MISASQAETEIVASIYHQRWQIELFFKWFKQHLRIQRFFGTSPNTVKIPVLLVFQRYKDEISTRTNSNQLTLFEI